MTHFLNPDQFRSQADRKEQALDPNHPRHGEPQWGEHPSHSTIDYVEDKNGKPLRIDTPTGFDKPDVEARRVNPETEDYNSVSTSRRVGAMTIFGGKPRYDGSNIDGGVIHKAVVSGPQRRKGVATAMLNTARRRWPDQDVRHSGALSEEGRGWAEATPTENDVGRKRPEVS